MKGNFFTSASDVRFWIRSAWSDVQLRRLLHKYGPARSLDLLYGTRDDPWGLNSPPFRYQQLKYSTMLSLLPFRHYERALDLGCGLGSFTRRLGDYAEQVLGIDLSHVAITEARQQTTEVTNVQFQQGDFLNLRTDLGDGFDLVVLADTLYYLSPLSNDVLETVRERVVRLLVPGGILLLTDHFIFTLDPGSRWSAKIHQCFRSTVGLIPLHESRRPFYLVSVLERARS
jgi:SAM-dependent methyltransferase